MKKFAWLNSVVIVILLLLGGGYYLYATKIEPTLPGYSGNNKGPQVTTDNTTTKISFKNRGPAPEFTGIDAWLNGEPQTVAALQGKVILVEFWTYSCKSCLTTLPLLNQWSETYKDQGLAVIGVHTPEYAFEKLTDNVQAALDQYHVTFPIALDNRYATWKAYGNQFWPTTYIIDRSGTIVYSQLGDGNPDITETAIRQVLSNTATITIDTHPTIIPIGLNHSATLSNTEKLSDQEQIYTLPKKLRANTVAIEGTWKLDAEQAVLTQGYGRVRIHLNNAHNVKLIAQSIKQVTITILVDGVAQDPLIIQPLQAYPIATLPDTGDHTIELGIPQDGFTIEDVTF